MKKVFILACALIILMGFYAHAEEAYVCEGPGAEDSQTQTTGEQLFRLEVGRELIKTNDVNLDPYYVWESSYTDASGELWYDTYGTKNTQLRASDCTRQTYVEVNTQDPTRQQMIVNAFSKLGNAYQYGSSGPDTFDCSGFTNFCYNSIGIGIPRSSHAICGIGNHIAREQLQSGDILATPGHVGVYVGNGIFIHAQDRLTGVTTDYIDVYNAYSYRPFSLYINVIDQ